MRQLLVLACLSLVTASYADEADFRFSSLGAKKALRDYRKATAEDETIFELKQKKLDDAIADAAKNNRDALIEDLKRSLKKTMQAGNLDEANNINAAIKMLESKSPVATSDSDSPILYRFFEYDEKDNVFAVHTNVLAFTELAQLKSYRGKSRVLLTHPESESEPAIFSKVVTLPRNGHYVLRMGVSHHIHNGINRDWLLIVRINDVPVMQQVVGEAIMQNSWANIEVNLQRFAGRMVKIDIIHAGGGPESPWNGEHGYWTHAEIVKK